MKIGDRVFVHGYIDEIRKDTVIIRNNGGYFGTVQSEVIVGELPSVQPRKGKWIRQGNRGVCSECHKYIYLGYDFNYCPNCGSYNGGDSDE